MTGAMCLSALAATGPKLQFEKQVYDFGALSEVETVAGTFKFKNVGDAVLKIEPPKPSCGCTVASLKPDTLQPGESGELAFTLNLGHSKAKLEKHISVTSNDQGTPVVSLTIKGDYTPLYDLAPMTLAPTLVFGANQTEQVANLTRTDGKPLGALTLEPSKPWITATLEPNPKDSSSARIRIVVKRDGPPRRFNEQVHVFAAGKSGVPVSNLFLYGQMMGEVSVTPDSLYWSINDSAQPAATRTESQVVRRVAISSADGQPLELKNPQSTIKGLHVELVPKATGKGYELVAKLDEPPLATVAGNLSFETSVAGQPRIEVPVIVNVFKP
jgi:hypothetical protein